jgi:DNA polymerase V
MATIRLVQPCVSSRVPLFGHAVRAGFPSPADDYVEQCLDLNEHIIHHPSATYFVRAQGDSMLSFGIHSGDLLIVDRALNAMHGDIVIAALDGDLTCKILDLRRSCLLSGNDAYAPIPLDAESNLIIEGVVTHSVRYHRCGV